MTVAISGKDEGVMATWCKQSFPVTAFVSALGKGCGLQADCLADDHSSRGRHTKKSIIRWFYQLNFNSRRKQLCSN